MVIKKVFVLLLSFFVFSACNNTDEENAIQKTEKQPTEEFEGIEILFDNQQFDHPKAIDLLKEINICSDAQVDEKGNLVTPCSPEYFKFFKLREDLSLEDGFILLVKANTGGIALRRVLVFERENGALVKVNGFIANLIGTKKRKDTNDDLLLRFIDKIDGSDYFYNCIFSWENGQYVFKTVEVISQPSANFNRRVKESMKDSVSVEIHQILLDNQMIF